MKKRWKKLLIPLAVLLLAACGGRMHVVAPGTEVRYQEVTREVKKPCPAKKPARPAPLARPLPKDNPRALIDVLVSKLEQWAGPGGYGEKADKALDLCLAP